jgi:starch phosphorylase
MNGALTIGTLDGANIEILEEVGNDNIYIFGLKAEDILAMRHDNSYRPEEYYLHSERVKRVMDTIKGEMFCPGEPGLFEWIFNALVHEGDHYFHLADFDAYVEAQSLAAGDFSQPMLWSRKAILNVARIGKFSSDRTIREYAQDIWGML